MAGSPPVGTLRALPSDGPRRTVEYGGPGRDGQGPALPARGHAPPDPCHAGRDGDPDRPGGRRGSVPACVQRAGSPAGNHLFLGDHSLAPDPDPPWRPSDVRPPGGVRGHRRFPRRSAFRGPPVLESVAATRARCHPAAVRNYFSPPAARGRSVQDGSALCLARAAPLSRSRPGPSQGRVPGCPVAGCRTTSIGWLVATESSLRRGGRPARRRFRADEVWGPDRVSAAMPQSLLYAEWIGLLQSVFRAGGAIRTGNAGCEA